MTLDDEVNNTLGAAFFCFVCGCVLYGITLSQVYQYHRTYPEDAWYLKATPTRLSPFRVFDTHDVVLASQRDWSGRYNGSSDLAVGDVHIFVIIGGCLALAAVIVFLIELHRIEFLLDYASGAKWILYFAFAVTCGVDIGITVGMCTILTKSRIRVKGVQVATNAVLSKIIIFFISSGLLTTLVSIVYMVLLEIVFLATRRTTVYRCDVLIQQTIREFSSGNIEWSSTSSLTISAFMRERTSH
ncbi:hypothetical protein AGABI1DRAFT_94299 [Agaricus bisporus var. burnettii JB137-S8]|uniref:DUF6534 domain-containing protein n=1 Tax=Agaricus bisporus var. burnettii (strain JB137-S8 / ATCC MYA-4627 / FGSC 10392) TaxID=597362 RepID=K5WLL9_AGABU|nr:uncharacterized protein AGABI1DRAFT_94299 [Agaricus bisporus var. burnettii JB137-S8]EKM76191.1 hypothetical protein AGABI1DRAFT_94299 [Agaricus bisporus var. burnettii JB137-S8]